MSKHPYRSNTNLTPKPSKPYEPHRPYKPSTKPIKPTKPINPVRDPISPVPLKPPLCQRRFRPAPELSEALSPTALPRGVEGQGGPIIPEPVHSRNPLSHATLPNTPPNLTSPEPPKPLTLEMLNHTPLAPCPAPHHAMLSLASIGQAPCCNSKPKPTSSMEHPFGSWLGVRFREF